MVKVWPPRAGTALHSEHTQKVLQAYGLEGTVAAGKTHCAAGVRRNNQRHLLELPEGQLGMPVAALSTEWGIIISDDQMVCVPAELVKSRSQRRS